MPRGCYFKKNTYIETSSRRRVFKYLSTKDRDLDNINPEYAKVLADRLNGPLIVKKYSNNKLMNSVDRMWINHSELLEEVVSGRDVVVFDKDTGEDITFKTLVGCMWSKGLNKGSTEALVELIRKSYE